MQTPRGALAVVLVSICAVLVASSGCGGLLCEEENRSTGMGGSMSGRCKRRSRADDGQGGASGSGSVGGAQLQDDPGEADPDESAGHDGGDEV